MGEFINRMKEAVEHIRQAQAIMSRGPLDYYLCKLVEHSEALLTRFSPINTGERAVIVCEVSFEGGWKDCTRTLAVGAAGTVHEVDYSEGTFFFDFVPDQQWYTGIDGEWKEKTRHHSYCLAEKYLQRLVPPGEDEQ